MELIQIKSHNYCESVGSLLRASSATSVRACGERITAGVSPIVNRTTADSPLAGLNPAYFGLVMATGIVSLAAHRLGMTDLGRALFWLNIPCYAALVGLYLIRAWRFPKLFLADLLDHSRAPGFFTFVAGSCVLGVQALLIGGNIPAARLLWWIGVVAWVVLIYTILTALTVKRDKPRLVEGINGGWLLAVVATQAIAVLAALLAARTAQPARIELNFLALSMWLWGGMLYIWMMSMIFYRYTFFRFSPMDLAPPYWINMGAMAISTLAGSLLIENASPQAPYLLSLMPFLKGFTVFYWATASWWIPMLLVLGVWRHGYRRHPFTYDPLYWGLVFPLGMYTVATLEMATVMRLDFLQPFPEYFVYVALAAWALVFIGLIRRVARVIYPAQTPD